MVTAEAGHAGASEQTLVVGLPFPGDTGAAAFTRADVVLTGVHHADASYETRLFFNNPGATIDTPRTPDEGYAGRLTAFGHGGCYGDEGHCDIPEPSTDPTDLRPPHPLTPLDTFVTVTEPLRRLLAAGDTLRTVTLVPVSITPRRADRKPAPELLHFADISVQTYLTSTEADADTNSESP
jgi:hypothetical protein